MYKLHTGNKEYLTKGNNTTKNTSVIKVIKEYALWVELEDETEVWMDRLMDRQCNYCKTDSLKGHKQDGHVGPG